MSNRTYRNVSLWYIATLVLIVAIPVICKDDIQPRWLWILLCLVLCILHFFVFIILKIYIDKRKDREFLCEYEGIYEHYKHTLNAHYLYEHLITIQKLPRTRNCKIAYYLNLSTAAYHIGKGKEAVEAIEHIDVRLSQELKETISKQKEMIRKKYAL